MMQGKLFQFAKCIFSVLMIADVASSNPPDSPCPQLFQYKFDGSDWIGLIELNNIKVNQSVNINVKLSVPTTLSSSFRGRLDLLEDEQKVVQYISQGKPIYYKVTFPLKNPIPRITKIVVDNAELCNGTLDQSPNTTRFQLYHVFFPNKITDVGEVFNEQMSSTIFSTSSLDESKTIDVDCEIPQLINALIEGSTIKRQWPWVTAIFLVNMSALTFQCSGTLLTSKVTVTAANCLFREGQRDPLSPNKVFTVLGRHDINNLVDAETEFLPTARIEFPPDFIKSHSFEKDIALILHKRPVLFANYPLIRPICLWSGPGNLLEIEGRTGTIVDWEMGEQRVDIISRKTCIRVNSRLDVLTADTNFCAAKRESEESYLRYSGSGLYITNSWRWELRGILVSAVPKQGATSNWNLAEYVVFLDIFAFKDWILKIMAI